MKSHIINIQLLNSNPLIWHRVNMPAGVTFKRLHGYNAGYGVIELLAEGISYGLG